MWRKREGFEKQQMCFLHGELSFEEKMLRFVVHFNQSVSYNWANNSEASCLKICNQILSSYI